MEASRKPTRSMTARAVAAAGEIMARWERERVRSPLDRIVAAEFRSRRYLNSGERRRLSAAVYGTVRFLRRQEFLLSRLALPASPETLIRLWLAVPAEAEGEETPAALPPSELPPLAAPERIAAALAALPGSDCPRDYLRITLSFPDDMAASLEELLGSDALAAARAFNTQAPTTLRFNPLHTTRAQVLAALPDAVPTRWSPWGLELPRRVNVVDLPGYRAGWFEVQEEASQLAALLTEAAPGQTVVEVGAGAGGKTLELAALMQNKGRLVALDTSPTRLDALQTRAERAGVRNLEICLLTANEHGDWQHTAASERIRNQLTGAADCVLLDAPCTGSGVIRRSPDAKWRPVDWDAVTGLQQRLLAQSAALVKPGGTLIYVTCAFEKRQNEEAVAAFLESAEGRSFAVEPVLPRLQVACRDAAEAETATLTAGPFLRTWPHRHHMDAFFGACLRRVSVGERRVSVGKR